MKLLSSVKKSRSQATKAAQRAPKAVTDLVPEIQKYGKITFTCHRPWLQKAAFSYRECPEIDRNDPANWNAKKMEFTSKRIKLQVQATEIFEVLPENSPLRPFMGQLDIIGVEVRYLYSLFIHIFIFIAQWVASTSSQKDHFHAHVKGAIVKYMPENSRIFLLSPQQRKVDPEAKRLCGSKKDNFPPCYYPNGDKTDRRRFGFIVALPCVRTLARLVIHVCTYSCFRYLKTGYTERPEVPEGVRREP